MSSRCILKVALLKLFLLLCFGQYCLRSCRVVSAEVGIEIIRFVQMFCMYVQFCVCSVLAFLLDGDELRNQS